ncbi:MAG TPA: glutathione synthase [Legionellales bacterium]|nr:glutathione synthase [Legionellales bacterium]|tara:strand:+ start:3031 stop:3972 length:942 start_codon:yes stop_codon:yes gene_type:complete
MKLAILMDPLSQLNLAKDTTLMILARAYALGWSCVYFTPQAIYCEQDEVYAEVTHIEVKSLDKQPLTTKLGYVQLSEFDIILMRKDPPFDMEYIYLTYMLELVEKKGVLVANKPQSLRDANEKFWTLTHPQCIAPSVVSRNISVLRAFWHTHQNVIYKPLSGMGGEGIFQVDAQGLNLSVILETLTRHQTVSIMAQRYIPAIKHTGDKRLLLINGTPIPYALARMPAKGELRGNLAAGGQGQVVAITARDKWLCQAIGPMLKQKGLYFVGMDVIGEYVTEINVTSPTCMREIAKETGIDIAGMLLDALSKAKV